METGPTLSYNLVDVNWAHKTLDLCMINVRWVVFALRALSDLVSSPWIWKGESATCQRGAKSGKQRPESGLVDIKNWPFDFQSK